MEYESLDTVASCDPERGEDEGGRVGWGDGGGMGEGGREGGRGEGWRRKGGNIKNERLRHLSTKHFVRSTYYSLSTIFTTVIRTERERY